MQTESTKAKHVKHFRCKLFTILMNSIQIGLQIKSLSVWRSIEHVLRLRINSLFMRHAVDCVSNDF